MRIQPSASLKEGPHQESDGPVTLDFTASRTVEINVCHLSPPVYGILLHTEFQVD